MQFFSETFLVFLSTEIDDFLVFVVLFALQKNAKSRASIFSGRFAAIVLVAIFSAFAASLLSKIPRNYLRYLGIIPIFIALLHVINSRKTESKNSADNKSKKFSDFSSFLSAFAASFLLTLASSADNIGIYIPFFLDLSLAEKIFAVLEIAFLNILWTILQIKSANITVVKKIVGQTSRVLVPVVFILLGISVLMMS